MTENNPGINLVNKEAPGKEIEKKYLITHITSKYIKKLTPKVATNIKQGYIYAGKDDLPYQLVTVRKSQNGNPDDHLTLVPVASERKIDNGRKTVQIGITRRELNKFSTGLNDNIAEMRIRQKGDKCFFTVKSDGDLKRAESEIEISQKKFNTLMPLTRGKRVEKMRFTVKESGYNYEFDLYPDGHMLLEVELPTEQIANAYTLPKDIGKVIDVTKDKAYKNKNIALLGFPQDPMPIQKYKLTPSNTVRSVNGLTLRRNRPFSPSSPGNT